MILKYRFALEINEIRRKYDDSIRNTIQLEIIKRSRILGNIQSEFKLNYFSKN
jgi:hypothetical protein